MKPACRWIDYDHMSCLQWNAMCIATVKPRAELFEVMIYWRGGEYGGPPCSRNQGKRFVERWVSARSGFPKDRGR